MDILNITKADQFVPISKARAILSTLINDVEEKNFLVLVKKYKPQAALVDLSFFNKLLNIYERWMREQDFATIEKIKKSLPRYPQDEVEKDISYAIKKIRITPNQTISSPETNTSSN